MSFAYKGSNVLVANILSFTQSLTLFDIFLNSKCYKVIKHDYTPTEIAHD